MGIVFARMSRQWPAPLTTALDRQRLVKLKEKVSTSAAECVLIVRTKHRDGRTATERVRVPTTFRVAQIKDLLAKRWDTPRRGMELYRERPYASCTGERYEYMPSCQAIVRVFPLSGRGCMMVAVQAWTTAPGKRVAAADGAKDEEEDENDSLDSFASSDSGDDQ
jgi:hypothetical protein